MNNIENATYDYRNIQDADWVTELYENGDRTGFPGIDPTNMTTDNVHELARYLHLDDGGLEPDALNYSREVARQVEGLLPEEKRQDPAEIQQYEVGIEYRCGGRWNDTEADWDSFYDRDDAIEAADDCVNCTDFDAGEYRALVLDEDGDEVYSCEWRIDPERDKFEAATWIINDRQEFVTECYGVGEHGEYLHTIQNGGSEGAHCRQEWDGRWSDMYDDVNEIELEVLLEAIISHEGGDVLDAARQVADVHPSESLEDIILSVADTWDWCASDKEAVLNWIEASEPTAGDKIKKSILGDDDL